jgi:tetratricopeptide (TPR) repeat protein
MSVMNPVERRVPNVQVVNVGNRHAYVYAEEAPYRVAAFPLAVLSPMVETEGPGPTALLAARHEVVSFARRDGERALLARWRDSSSPDISVRLLHGVGGQGKTRLAIQFVRESACEGWTVAAATHSSRPPIHSLRTGAISDPEKLQVGGRGLLLAVDCAERWSAADLLQLIGDHRMASGGPVRVLLVARCAASWWRRLVYQLAGSDVIDVEDLSLVPLARDPSVRAELFVDAVTAFAVHLQLDDPESIAAPALLDYDSGYEVALTLQMAAWAAVDAHLRSVSAPPESSKLAKYLLERERDHWAALYARRQIATTASQMARAVYSAILTRGLRHDDAVTVLNSGGIADDSESARQILLDHSYCYPPRNSDTFLEPLCPDRLAEEFLALVTPGLPEVHPGRSLADPWALAAVRKLITPVDDSGRRHVSPHARNALILLIDAAIQADHLATNVLYPLLRANPELALMAGGAALARLAELPNVDIGLLEAIEPQLFARQDIDLDCAFVSITSRLSEHQLRTATGRANRGRMFVKLGRRLGHVGDPDAVAATREAVAIYRELADSDPTTYSPPLAEALDFLGVDLAAVGGPEYSYDALMSTREAVEIYRRLATTNPEEFEPPLARSLANLSGRFGETQRESALTAAEEAVQIRRRIAAANPDRPDPQLGRYLTNVAVALSELGRPHEALAAAQEAAESDRSMAESRPGEYVADLARDLGNLGHFYSEVHRWEDASAATHESAHIYRQLATSRATVFEPYLASQLASFGIQLARIERWEEAQAATSEAVELYRQLAVLRPKTYDIVLATALSNLARQLSKMERWDEARVAINEAEEVHRRAAATWPQTPRDPASGGR